MLRQVVDSAFLARSYETFASIEEAFGHALDASLQPRGSDTLFELVAELRLPPGARAIDIGCGEGRHAIELARRFGFRVDGIDPVERHLALARSASAEVEPGTPADLRFTRGVAEQLPFSAASFDLAWCRDVLVHSDNLSAAYAEIRRVLKPGARALIYQIFATERLEPMEAAWLLPTMGCVAANMQPAVTEAAISGAGFRIEECLVLGTEWGEYGEERSGRAGRKLLHGARLLRAEDRFREEFGDESYELALGDALWHVYRMIGKLSDRVYLLSAP